MLRNRWPYPRKRGEGLGAWDEHQEDLMGRCQQKVLRQDNDLDNEFLKEYNIINL